MHKKFSNKILNIIFALGAAIILASDQAVKYIIKGMPRELLPITLIPNFLFITRITNSGAAFGIFPSKTKILIIISIIAIILIIILKIKIPINSFFYNLALGFILGGAIGNLIDRVIIGEVTDYLYVAYFAVFNLADSFIVIGFGIIIIIIIRSYFKKGAI